MFPHETLTWVRTEGVQAKASQPGGLISTNLLGEKEENLSAAGEMMDIDQPFVANRLDLCGNNQYLGTDPFTFQLPGRAYNFQSKGATVADPVQIRGASDTIRVPGKITTKLQKGVTTIRKSQLERHQLWYQHLLGYKSSTISEKNRRGDTNSRRPN